MFNAILRWRDSYLALPRWQKEAIILGSAVLVGFLVMPALIYLAGRLTLREYANGGLFALYFDFFKSLFRFESTGWIVVAGPFGFLTLLRLFRLIFRKI